MSPTPGGYVVDASVLIKLFVEETLSARVHQWFQGISESSLHSLHAPELIYSECSNVLWKYVRRFGMPSEEAVGKLDSLQGLDVKIIPTKTILSVAFRIALDYDVSVYDASYLAVSCTVGAPLITADERLIAKTTRSRMELVLLSEVV